MSADLQREPDYDALLQTLLQKSREGKLVWQETADPASFIAAARGERTFEISRSGDSFDLTVCDSQGRQILRMSAATHNVVYFDSVRDLYQLAKRIATHLDEKIDSTMELLGSL